MVCSAGQRIDGVELSRQRDQEGLREQAVCHRYELEIPGGTENGGPVSLIRFIRALPQI